MSSRQFKWVQISVFSILGAAAAANVVGAIVGIAILAVR